MDLIIDIDGVLRDIVNPILGIYKREVNPASTVTYQDIQLFDLKPFMPEIDDIVDFFFKVHAKEVFYHSSPFPYVVEVMKSLYEKHYVHLVTHQYPNNEGFTVDWIYDYEIPFHAMTFMREKHKIYGDVMVDDAIHNLTDYGEKGLNRDCVCIAIDQPWNKDWVGFRAQDMRHLEKIVHGAQTIYDYNNVSSKLL